MAWKVKRSVYVFFWVEDSPHFDVADFLQGELKASEKPQLFSLSLLTESRRPIALDDVRLLADLPAVSWTTPKELVAQRPGFDVRRLEGLARQGLLVTDSTDPDLVKLRWRDELLTAQQWHPYAAFYHFMTREREQNGRGTTPPETKKLAAAAAEDTASFVRLFGPPPPPFHRSAEPAQATELPLTERSGEFYEVLRQRKSTRAFDSARPLPLEDFNTLLRYAFGCHGYTQPAPEVVLLHKTSPSGGALHPIEAYPLVLNVESLATGFYHYNVEDHSLELLRELSIADGRDLALEISGGQAHARAAHALVVLTARFHRYFWKYRQRSQAYGAVLMDAGHLSQTFYLVATELNLATFYSAVVDGPRVEDMLGLQAPEESALGICACGVKAPEGPDLGLDFQPYVPRETII